MGAFPMFVDVISYSKILVVDGIDPNSDPSEATHTTIGISGTDTTNVIPTRQLFPLFVNPAIQAVVRPVTPLVTVKVKVAQESLSLRQTSLLQASITDAARPCA